jgi:uncharacterized protein (TIGR02453 family)
MAYFTNDFLEFFKELAGNNNKDWFDMNRKRYEKEIKDPFKKLVLDLIEAVDSIEGDIKIEPKNCIFRINRDVRFSKDKTPYKTKVSAIVSKGGKKDHKNPGVYIELGPEHFRIYGGIYKLDKDDLLAVREYITENQSAFKKAINNKDFVSNYGEIHGEKNKILPKHIKEFGEEIPLLYNKNWYFYSTLAPETILKEDLIDIILDHHKSAKQVNTFFKKALLS